MKYKMLKELPFIKAGEIFGKGCWVGGGWGVDLGETKYSNGGGSSNGIRTFEEWENKILDKLLLNKDWVKMLPESAHELLNLYEEKYYRKDEVLDLICLKSGGIR